MFSGLLLTLRQRYCRAGFLRLQIYVRYGCSGVVGGVEMGRGVGAAGFVSLLGVPSSLVPFFRLSL